MAGDYEYIQAAGQACLNEDCYLFGVTGQGNIQRFGVTGRGVQRFRCKKCLKTFNELAGTPMHRLRHDEATVLEAATDVLVGGQSISDVARSRGVPYSTVKRWVDAVGPYEELTGRVDAELERWRRRQAWRLTILSHAQSMGLLTDAQYTAAMDHATEGLDDDDGADIFPEVLRELVTLHGDLATLLEAVHDDFEKTFRFLSGQSD